MIYAVQAHFRPNTAADFLHKLTDGTIQSQYPDGREIVASMKRAVIDKDGTVRWSETCYCPTPLQHERETVYDNHFTDFHTNVAEDDVQFQGRPFMEYLEEQARRD